MIKIERPNIRVKGTITSHLKDGSHYTYRVRDFSPDVREGRKEPRLVVELLTGPDNSRSYTGFAFVGFSGPVVWHRLKDTDYSVHVRRLDGRTDDVVQWLQAGKCMRCGRKLTTPESIADGIGPVCGGRV